MQINLLDQELTPSPTLHINERVDALWRSGESVFHLGFGESRFPVHPLLRESLGDAAREKSYLPAKGLIELRRAVARYHGERLGFDVNVDRVMIGPGSKALIYGFQMALNADLYLWAPAWVSYAAQARLLGKTVHFVPGRLAEDHQPDLERLDEALGGGGQQKLLIINSPNNPTGRMLSDEFLQALADFCRERRLIVLSDEIYGRVHQPEVNHASLASYYPEGTFLLSGPSKHLSLGGWRLGVIIAPDTDSGYRTLDAMAAIASEIWSAVAAPVQRAAVTAYSGHPEIENYIETCARIHSIRTRFICDGLRNLGIRTTEPQGAFYVMANFDHWAAGLAARGIQTSSDLASYLLEHHYIATLPGDAFGLPQDMLSLRIATSYLDMESEDKAEALLTLFRTGIDPEAFMSPEHHPGFHDCLGAFRAFVTGLHD